MKANIERELKRQLMLNGPYNRTRKMSVREIIFRLSPALGFVPKQAWATLKKWADKDWYEWGTSLDLGWLTQEGYDHFKQELE